MAERDSGLLPQVEVIGPTVPEVSSHLRYLLSVNRLIEVDDARESAHERQLSHLRETLG
jgi:hypothetical protein